MSKENSSNRKSTEQKDNIAKETAKASSIINQPQSGYSSEESKFEISSGYLSGGLSSQYEELLKTEQKLKEINEKIKWYKEKLKPINRVDRKRGVKSTLTPTDRKLSKAMLKKLETERVTENENWQIQYAIFSESSYEEIERTKKDRYVELGRSGYYAKKNSGSIITRIKSLLDNTLNENRNELISFKTEVVKSDEEKVPHLIHAFIKEYEENPFLSTFYISHKSLQVKYTKLITDLLAEWDERTKEEYSFKNSEIKLVSAS